MGGNGIGGHARINEGPPSEDAGPGRSITREHVVDLVAIVGLVFLMIIAVRTTIRLDHLSGLLVLAVVLSYLTAPLRHRLGARIGDGAAAALVPLLTFAVIVGIAVAVSKDTTSQATRIAARAASSDVRNTLASCCGRRPYGAPLHTSANFASDGTRVC